MVIKSLWFNNSNTMDEKEVITLLAVKDHV